MAMGLNYDKIRLIPGNIFNIGWVSFEGHFTTEHPSQQACAIVLLSAALQALFSSLVLLSP
jgi:hypothetical protein